VFRNRAYVEVPIRLRRLVHNLEDMLGRIGRRKFECTPRSPSTDPFDGGTWREMALCLFSVEPNDHIDLPAARAVQAERADDVIVRRKRQKLFDNRVAVESAGDILHEDEVIAFLGVSEIGFPDDVGDCVLRARVDNRDVGDTVTLEKDLDCFHD